MNAETVWPLRSSYISHLPKELRPTSRQWASTAYPWQIKNLVLERMQALSSISLDPKANIDEHVIIRGNVHVGKGVRIYPFTTIDGTKQPVFIADDATVGNNSLIRGSVLCRGSVVGFGSEIVRSIIGPATTVHNSFVGDSWLGRSVEVTEYNTLTAYALQGRPVRSLVGNSLMTLNEKFGSIVGNNTSFGVNCGVMPGRKIGERCTIFPGTIVQRDIPDGKTAISESHMTIF